MTMLANRVCDISRFNKLIGGNLCELLSVFLTKPA